jgi:hypothetical protein
MEEIQLQQNPQAAGKKTAQAKLFAAARAVKLHLG